MKVDQVKSPVIQMDDYYPFGLTFNSYQRENSIANQYLYNSKENQEELGLGWLDYGARMYLPEIGRWNAIDAKSEKYFTITPYNFVLNNPQNFVDTDGRDFEAVVKKNKKGGSDITIRTTVHTYGNSSNETRARFLNDVAKKLLSASGKFGEKGENTLSFQVSFEHHESVDDAKASMKEGDNLMKIDVDMTTEELQQTQFYGTLEKLDKFTGGVAIVGGKESNVRSLMSEFHELGHNLGLSDRYTTMGVPDKGFDEDIMTANYPSSVNQVHYSNIGNFILNDKQDRKERTEGDTRIRIYTNFGRIPEKDRKKD